ncbi:MAG: 3-methyl-2-oxobutanoate dehydrogenase subunit beta, partial [Firmicutes bacterium]|nr:3-methyl-2-oxobutanoate dehydrogenase subunit beta [Bacillota bacterium]
EYKAPTLVLMDGCIGSLMEPVELPPMKDVQREEYPIYTSPFMNPYNPKRRCSATMITDERDQEQWNKVQAARYATIAEKEVQVEEYMMEDAEYVIVAYGTSARVAKSTIRQLRDKGIKAGLIRPITVWPFPYDSLKKLDEKQVKGILCLELSIPALMVEDIERGVQGRIPIATYGRSAGIVFSSEEVEEQMMLHIEQDWK